MDTLISVLMLAASLVAGIVIGARLARANYGFVKSLVIQVLLFISICVVFAYLEDRALVCVVTALAATIAAWLGTKTAPEPVSTSMYSGANAVSPVHSGQTATPFGKRTQPPANSGNFTERVGNVFPLGHFRKAKRPSRTTPTGKTIRLVTSTDSAPTARRKGHLSRVK